MLVKLRPTTKQLPKQNKLKHAVQLDALRAIAVFSVLIYHWLPKQLFLNSTFEIGFLGVKFFFVLSGFLITLVLLEYRDKIALKPQTFWQTIRRFYIRRCLRIFPGYYLTIFFTSIFLLKLHPSFIWHLSYTSNFYYSWHKWDINSPFWSLAIEYQFYLFWPFVIFLVPKPHLEKVILSTIFVAPIFKILCLGMAWNGIRINLLTPACLDSLALGALLAFYTYNQNQAQAKKSLCNWGLWLGGSLSVFLIITKQYVDPGIRLIVTDSVNAFFFVWLIDRAARGFSDITGTILEFKPLVYVGKISYGIYVYHSFIAALVVPKMLSYVGVAYPRSVAIQFVLNTLTTILLAMLSWKYIEQPINNLKRNYKI